MIYGIIKIDRGKDVKNLNPSCKVTIQAPLYFDSAETAVGEAEVSLAASRF